MGQDISVSKKGHIKVKKRRDNKIVPGDFVESKSCGSEYDAVSNTDVQ